MICNWKTQGIRQLRDGLAWGGLPQGDTGRWRCDRRGESGEGREACHLSDCPCLSLVGQEAGCYGEGDVYVMFYSRSFRTLGAAVAVWRSGKRRGKNAKAFLRLFSEIPVEICRQGGAEGGTEIPVQRCTEDTYFLQSDSLGGSERHHQRLSGWFIRYQQKCQPR